MHSSSCSRQLVAALCCAAVVAGCGGSVSLGFGFGDDRPSASLAVSPTSASPGQALRLVAAASDDFGVDFVEFYRVDSSGSTLLGFDGLPPYQLDTTVPANAAGSVQFFARAIDGAGQRGDSAVVTVSVGP
ncbi:hypothetical protein [Methylibium sp.]|uniref:hypothetical protein n=1 Tax=Methylibium sp. TaxID=2067992 RepID=UPI003D114725